nr:DNA topoisomerase 2-like [Tanacetum cinerariifolium]
DEASLVGNIVGMAQNYVGSNNINLLQPKGQFGTRHMGGKDHVKGRDLFTQLPPITRYIFLEDDELLLKYLKDDAGVTTRNEAKKEEYDLLTETSPESLWRKDLTALDHQLKACIQEIKAKKELEDKIDDMKTNRKMTVILMKRNLR